MKGVAYQKNDLTKLSIRKLVESVNLKTEGDRAMKRKSISMNEEAYKALRAVKDELSTAGGTPLTWTHLMFGIGNMNRRSREMHTPTSAWLQGVSNRYHIPKSLVEEVVWGCVRRQSAWRISRNSVVSLKKVRGVCRQLKKLDETTFGRVLFSIYVSKSPDLAEVLENLGERTPADKDEPEPVGALPSA